MASSWETLQVNGTEMRAYLSLPDGAGPFPGVVVSQHGGGVDQFIRDMSDRLAGRATRPAPRSCTTGSPQPP